MCHQTNSWLPLLHYVFYTPKKENQLLPTKGTLKYFYRSLYGKHMKSANPLNFITKRMLKQSVSPAERWKEVKEESLILVKYKTTIYFTINMTKVG